MSKKSKKQNINGWLIIDKAAGPSSAQVVNKLRWLLNAKKAGHAGTLDPQATGLLAIAFGEATKVIPHVTDDLKTYTFMVNLGAATNTDDAEGDVIKTSDLRPDTDAIQDALPHFTGAIQQVPPEFSAVKIDGERAYKAARRGDEITLKPRDLWVEKLEIISRPAPDCVELLMQCGKGGYVRAIARDLGHHLGCLGHVKWLRRIDSGPFDLTNATTLDAIDALETPALRQAELLPLETALTDIPYIEINDADADRIDHGMSINVTTAPNDPDTVVYVSHNGLARALGTITHGVFQPKRVLLQGSQ